MAHYYCNDYLPDLYYDHQELPSPPSATSSNMISTPPLDWQPWVPTDEKSEFYQSAWNPSPESQWIYQQQQPYPQALAPTSILFSSYEQPLASDPTPAYSHEPPLVPAPQSATLGFVSPFSTVFSSSPLSHTTSPPGPAPPLAPTAQPPSQGALKLHQPRPSRRIPIVSLSKLALACDEFQIRPKEPNDQSSHFSGEVGHLPFRTAPSSPYHPMAYHASNQYNGQGSQSKIDIYGTPFPGSTGRLSQCSCGCMTPYTCQ